MKYQRPTDLQLRTRRQHERHRLKPPRKIVQIAQPGLGRLHARLSDISLSGFQVDCLCQLDLDAPISLEIEGQPPFAARIVWSNSSTFGCQFRKPISEQELEHIAWA